MSDRRKKRSISGIVILMLIVMVFAAAPVSAASKKNTGVVYYATILNPYVCEESQNKPNYWLAGVDKATYKKNTITFYGTFSKSKKESALFTKKAFVKYGKKTFKVTSKTKYFCKDIWKKYPMSKKRAFNMCKRLNGLCLTLKVKNGKVEYMRFTS